MQVLPCTTRAQFRAWLVAHADDEAECWLLVKRGRPTDPDTFYYLDAVEEALCFGWIDSTYRRVDGVCYQRFSPRAGNSLWTELNKERVRRLDKLGLMTDRGRRVLPDMAAEFCIDPDVRQALEEAGVYDAFLAFPLLYRRVRAYNVAFYKHRDAAAYRKALRHLIDATAAGKTYGEWNDYGRLSDY